MKAVILARVSTLKQEKEGLSLKDIQLPELRDYAVKRDFKVVKEFVFSESMDFDNMDELKGIDPVLDAILYPDDLDQEDELDDEGYEIWDEEEDDEWDEEDDDDLEY